MSERPGAERVAPASVHWAEGRRSHTTFLGVSVAPSVLREGRGSTSVEPHRRPKTFRGPSTDALHQSDPRSLAEPLGNECDGRGGLTGELAAFGGPGQSAWRQVGWDARLCGGLDLILHDPGDRSLIPWQRSTSLVESSQWPNSHPGGPPRRTLKSLPKAESHLPVHRVVETPDLVPEAYETHRRDVGGS